MPVLRFPHLPTGFASGGRVTTRGGLSDPATSQRPPLCPQPCGLCLWLAPALGTKLAVTPRDNALFCHKQTNTERGSGASSPWLKPGVSAPRF